MIAWEHCEVVSQIQHNAPLMQRERSCQGHVKKSFFFLCPLFLRSKLPSSRPILELQWYLC